MQPSSPEVKKSRTCKIEEITTWKLSVRMMSGTRIGFFTVDECTTVKDIHDGIQKPSNGKHVRIQLFAGSQQLTRQNATLRDLKILNITELTAVTTCVNNFCPRCRAACRPRGFKDKFARLMEHDAKTNPTHQIGLRFSDPDVSAVVSWFEEDQTVFDCFNDLQVHPISVEEWNRSGHAAIYHSIFSNTHNYAEYDKFSKTVILAMNEKDTEFAYWRASSRQNSLFTVGCKHCRYFLHTSWRKGSNPSCLKRIWWAWLMEEPDDCIDEVVLTPNKTSRRDGSSKSTTTNSSSNSSFSTPSSSKRQQQLEVSEDEDDEPPPLIRRCALEGPTHFPPVKAPDNDDKKDEDISAVNELTDLTQRCRL